MIKKLDKPITDYPRDEYGRIQFAKIPDVMEIPNLLAIQLESYAEFLQREVPIDKRKDQGLESVFNSVFPIESPKGKYKLEYHGYIISEPKYSEEECKERDLTFAAPLKARLRLVINEEDEESGEKRLKDIIQSEVFLGEIPILTKKGTFIINGAERVIVSQLHRSPGVFFGDEIHPNGKRLFNARIIPYRGSWVEFTIDINDVMFVNIDRRRKLPVSVLLKAMGFDTAQAILRIFHQEEIVKVGQKSGKKDEEIVGRIAIQDVTDKASGEVIVEAGHVIEEKMVEKLRDAKVTAVHCIKYTENEGPEDDVILKTLKKDTSADQEAGTQEDLQPDSSRRSPESGNGARLVAAHVLHTQALRLGTGGSLQDQPALEAQRPAGDDDARPGRFHRRHRVPARHEGGRRGAGRHRSPGQPSYPFGGRVARQPVLDRPGAHGPHRQGAHDAPAGQRPDHAVRS